MDGWMDGVLFSQVDSGIIYLKLFHIVKIAKLVVDGKEVINWMLSQASCMKIPNFAKKELILFVALSEMNSFSLILLLLHYSMGNKQLF